MTDNNQIFALLGSLTTSRRKWLTGAACATMVGGLAANVPAILLGRIVDTVSQGFLWMEISMLFILIVASLAIREGLIFFQKQIVETIATSLWRREFISVTDSLMTASLSSVQGFTAGEVAVAAEKGADAKVKLLKLVFIDLLPNLALAFAAIALTTLAHWSLAIILPLIVIASFLVTWRQFQTQSGVRERVERRKSALGGNIARILVGLPYVRASGLSECMTHEINAHASEVKRTELSHHKAMMRYDALKQLIEGIGFAVAIGLAVLLASTGAITTGEILTLAVLFRGAMTPIQHLHRVIDEFQSFSAQSKQISKLQALVPWKPDGPVIIPDRASRSVISASDVTLRSSQNGSHTILDHFTVSIEAGEQIGVVGPSGSGKSTFFLSCLGLFPEYDGSLKILGSEARSIDQKRLTKMISYCPQTPFIMPGSVRKNIGCIAESQGKILKDCELEDVIHSVGLEHRLLNSNIGLDFEIQEFGSELSGGEQQRLMIARALLCDASIYFFDECTSQVDSVIEAMILQNIRKRLSDRTCLFIAHRLNTLEDVDRVIVVEKGAILETGTFRELALSDGLFQRMLNKQTESVSVTNEKNESNVQPTLECGMTLLERRALPQL